MVISANRIQASVLWFVARPTNRGESVAKIRDEEMPEALVSERNSYYRRRHDSGLNFLVAGSGNEVNSTRDVHKQPL